MSDANGGLERFSLTSSVLCGGMRVTIRVKACYSFQGLCKYDVF